MVLVANTLPWTYLGRLPVDPLPGASFDLGLDLLALHEVGLAARFGWPEQALGRRQSPPRGPNVVHRHDLAGFRRRPTEPVAFQVDGDYLGRPRSASPRFQGADRAGPTPRLRKSGSCGLERVLTCGNVTHLT